MLVLTGTDFPASASAISAAAKGGFAMFLQLPPGEPVVQLTGDHPHLSLASINLTHASTDAHQLPPEPRGLGNPTPAFEADRLEVVAQPLRVRGNPLTVSLTADSASFAYDRDSAGRPVLLLRDCRNGQLTASITRSDVQSLILSLAREAGDAHGISILEANLQWTQLDARSIGVAVSVTARKLVTAQITVVGRLRIDDAMVARLTDLECSGAGMISALACGIIRPKLQRVENKTLNLAELAAGEVRLRDVKVTVGEMLVVQAQFGG